MAAKTVVLDNQLLSAVLRNVSFSSPATVYAALFTVAPTTAYTSGTPTGTEVTDGNYVRLATTFSSPSGGVTSNSGTLTFYGAGKAAGTETVVAVGIFDALTLGNLLYFGNLAVSKVVGTGDTVSFAATTLSVTES